MQFYGKIWSKVFIDLKMYTFVAKCGVKCISTYTLLWPNLEQNECEHIHFHGQIWNKMYVDLKSTPLNQNLEQNVYHLIHFHGQTWSKMYIDIYIHFYVLIWSKMHSTDNRSFLILLSAIFSLSRSFAKVCMWCNLDHSAFFWDFGLNLWLWSWTICSRWTINNLEKKFF